MSEKPILFSGPMARAILEGRKTQTRRVVRPQPLHGVGRYTEDGTPGEVDWVILDEDGDPTDSALRCPYGAPGDALWVRETWAPLGDILTEVIGRPRVFRADADLVRDDSGDRVGWWLGETFLEGSERPFRWRPSLHMPRWASRITLDVVSVRVERLQEITGPGILAEGAVARPHDDPLLGRCPVSAFDGCAYPDLMSLWRAGWDSINGKRPGCSWADDPWVWVVEFRRRPGAIAKENQP